MSELAVARAALPRSLAARVLLIIIAGLIVAHLASFALFEIERARAIDRYSASEVASRIVEHLRSPATSQSQAQQPPPQSQPGQRGGPPRPRQRLRWQDVEDVSEPPARSVEPSSVFTSELRRLLTDGLGEDPVVWVAVRDSPRPVGPPKGPMPGSPRDTGAWPDPAPEKARDAVPRPDRPDRPTGLRTGLEGPKLVTVALKLPEGKQALAEASIFQPSLTFPPDAWIAIALLFAVTAFFSILAVRLAVQPVRMLADAADRLSRNLDEPPLPEKGAQEIRAATRAFNRMQDRLRRHVNSRALAFAAMSHDIRTPLTRMRLRLESMGDAAKQKLGGDLDEIEGLARSALEVTRGLSSDEPMRPVNIDSLVERLLMDYEPLGRKIYLSGKGRTVQARPAALRRALANLIDNAIKYGGEDVSVELAEAREHVTIRVCDRGPGIPAEHIEKVLYPFYRVESSRNRGTGGAGLGLAIAKDIVEGHGGELALENREGGGLCVTIRLPS